MDQFSLSSETLSDSGSLRLLFVCSTTGQGEVSHLNVYSKFKFKINTKVKILRAIKKTIIRQTFFRIKTFMSIPTPQRVILENLRIYSNLPIFNVNI